MSKVRDDIAGGVLTGGRSSRMTRNKALLTIDGIPFIQRIVRTLGKRFSLVYVSANREDEYRFLERPIVPDRIMDGGPLAGIHSLMQVLPVEYLLTVSCDVPYLSIRVIDALVRDLERDTVIVAHDGDRIHPLIGVYPRSVSGQLETYLETGGRKVSRFLETVRYRSVNISRYRAEVRNINTPTDYKGKVTR
jgi:molybdenum cofactor guanylyltransferase